VRTIGLLLLLTVTAWGQTDAMHPANTIAVTHSPPTAGLTQAISTPASFGAPHVCGDAYYPALAVSLGETGTTTLAFKITTSGTVDDITVDNSSGHDDLDDAAVLCAKQFRYRPAMVAGIPVEVPWKVTVKWSLEGFDPAVTTLFFSMRRNARTCPAPAGTRLTLPRDQPSSRSRSQTVVS